MKKPMRQNLKKKNQKKKSNEKNLGRHESNI